MLFGKIAKRKSKSKFSGGKLAFTVTNSGFGLRFLRRRFRFGRVV
jgi:hypothetical protein